MRVLKINTVFSLDGLRVCLSGKSGNQISLKLHTSLILNNEQMTYVKKLESYREKQKEKNIRLSEKYDGITKEKNAELYSILADKACNTILKKLPGNKSVDIKNGFPKFNEASIEEQVKCLLQIVALYKTGRSRGCNLKCIGGAEQSGVVTLNLNLSNWRKNYTDIRIIDQSASGLYETSSCNLLELL